MSSIVPQSATGALRLLLKQMESTDENKKIPDFSVVILNDDGSFSTSFKCEQSYLKMIGALEELKLSIQINVSEDN